MSLIVEDILHFYNGDLKDERISKIYITVSKKLLGQAYEAKNGSLVSGKLLDISVSMEREKITESAVPGRDRLVGLKFDAYFVPSSGSDKDFLFLSGKISKILTEYAIFPDEYQIKVEFFVLSFKLKKIKLYTKGTVIDSSIPSNDSEDNGGES